MYFLLILFFGSLFGIIVMTGRKLFLLKRGLATHTEEISFEIPHLEKVKHNSIKNIKKHGHAGVVGILRFYIRSNNFLKNKYEEIKIKITRPSHKSTESGQIERAEENKFLKMISDYKHKIREIKQKIKEEEKG
jgi:hypothetical protein